MALPVSIPVALEIVQIVRDALNASEPTDEQMAIRKAAIEGKVDSAIAAIDRALDEQAGAT
jgi:hypothetical protein